MRVLWDERAWEQYLSWQTEDRKTLKRINMLIRDIQRDPYILGKIHVSPFGTIRKYKIHYINEPPKCEKCGTELRFILNPRSSKNRCPKCGSNNMRIGNCGFYD